MKEEKLKTLKDKYFINIQRTKNGEIPIPRFYYEETILTLFIAEGIVSKKYG